MGGAVMVGATTSEKEQAMMGYGYGYGMGAGMWVTWILLLAVIALVVWLVVRAGDGGREPARRPAGRVSPKEILDGRYARGEIATAEYAERLSHFVGD